MWPKTISLLLMQPMQAKRLDTHAVVGFIDLTILTNGVCSVVVGGD